MSWRKIGFIECLFRILFFGMIFLHTKKNLQKCIKLTKAKYYSNKLKYSVIDSKSTRKILNELLRPNKSNCKINLTISGQILTTPEKVAVSFKDYFSNVGNLRLCYSKHNNRRWSKKKLTFPSDLENHHFTKSPHTHLNS